MEKNEFVGWNVRVTTKTGSIIEGCVSEVDDIDCRLTLINAQVTVGKKIRQVELVSVQGEDIVDLQVTTKSSLSPAHKDPAILRTSSDSTVAKNKKNSWVDDDIKELKKTEFDFESNLLMFDKKKAFEEMKGTLKPEDLLVTHNAKPKSQSLGSLNQQPQFPYQQQQQQVKQIAKEKLFESNDLKQPRKKAEEQPVNALRILQNPNKRIEDVVEERRDELARVKLSPSTPEFMSVVGRNAKVPLVNEETMNLIEQKASKLTGPTTDQQLESASREIMRVLLSEELASVPTSSVILVGNHREGAIALAVGRSLANRGVSVSAIFPSGFNQQSLLNDHVVFQKKLFLSAGGKIVDQSDVSECDLIVDGAMGRGDSIASGEFQSVLDSIETPFVASIERPTKKCECLFAIAFPKAFHRNPRCPVFLVDINLPLAAFKSALPDVSLTAIFGTKLSVRLR